MKKEAAIQSINRHLDGNPDNTSKKIMNNVYKRLTEAGLQPPFTIKIAQGEMGENATDTQGQPCSGTLVRQGDSTGGEPVYSGDMESPGNPVQELNGGFRFNNVIFAPGLFQNATSITLDGIISSSPNEMNSEMTSITYEGTGTPDNVPDQPVTLSNIVFNGSLEGGEYEYDAGTSMAAA